MKSKNFGVDEKTRFLWVESKGLLKKSWKKYFSKLDTTKGELLFYNDELMKKLKKSFPVNNSSFFDAVVRKNKPCCIRIVQNQGKKSKELFVYAESLNDIDELKVDLEQCSANFEGQDKEKKSGLSKILQKVFMSSEKKKLEKLENIDIDKWSKKDMINWLKLMGYKSKDLKVFEDNDIDGKILDEIDEKILINIGVKEEMAKTLSDEIKRLNTNKKFSINRHMVKRKMANFPDYDASSKEFQSMIDDLSDVARLKHKFLSTVDLTAHAINEKGEEEECVCESFSSAKVHIKLVITEVPQTSTMFQIKRAMSPMISALIPQLQPDFGMFHTAIIVGPWYLEWTDTELIIPKRMVCGKAVISADVDTLFYQKKDLHKITDKLAEVVVNYNTQKKYRVSDLKMKGKGGMEANCQDFVDDILDALGVTNKFEGALGEFINKLKTTGKAVLSFLPCHEFKEYFAIQEKVIQFNTHKELDQFCLDCKKKCVDVDQMFQSEWTLLKSFDRAFWLRHLKMPENEKYQAMPPDQSMSYKPFASGCPFQDPRLTQSYKY